VDISQASAIVTGGASGLGAATAKLLASHGMRVVVLDLQEDRGAKIATEIDGVHVTADVADEEQVAGAVAARQ
jgi:NAD(P)-dependent dehydrogenase (short-subunit alcohol dehydrogenase family)